LFSGAKKTSSRRKPKNKNFFNMIKGLSKIIFCFFFGVFGGIFADQIFWPYFVEKPLLYQYRLEKNPIYLTEKKEIHIEENTALVEAVSRAEKTIVAVRTKTPKNTYLTGSGLIITSDGLMAAPADLFPDNGNFIFYWGEKTPEFQILKKDKKQNLALVQLKGENFSTTGFANLEKLKLGQRVFLIGAVFKNSLPSKTVNEGIIKMIDNNFIYTNILEKNPLSGSVLFDIKGDILGLNMIDKEGEVKTIPISKIKAFAGF